MVYHNMKSTDDLPRYSFPDAWPTDNGRFVCNKDHPMPSDAHGWWAHETVKEIDEEDGWVQYMCRACGHTWWNELPE